MKYKIKQKIVVDVLIYTGLSILFAIIMFLIEFFLLGTKDWSFLLWFRLGSIVVDALLWRYFEKTRELIASGLIVSKYWANTISFILIIQILYIVRLVLFKSHFNNLGLYIVVVLASSFVIAPIIIWIKDYIKKQIENRKNFV